MQNNKMQGSEGRLWFGPPKVTPARVWIALSVAVVTDLIQLLLGPAGWFGAVQILDVLAMLIIMRAIGFHPLLLPTFVAEMFPFIDFLPTWTGCTLAVLGMRRWSGDTRPGGKGNTPATVTIDTEVTVTPSDPAPPPVPKPPPASER